MFNNISDHWFQHPFHGKKIDITLRINRDLFPLVGLEIQIQIADLVGG